MSVRTNRVSVQLELDLDTLFSESDRQEMLSEIRYTLKTLPYIRHISTEIDV